jgi:exopolysaccharide production protein ExoZ
MVAWSDPVLMIPWRVFLYGIPAALLLWGVVSLEMAGELRVPRLFAFVGDISYSLYLWHLVVLSLLLILWPFPVAGMFGSGCFFLAGITGIGLVSVASFQWLERPSMRCGRMIVALLAQPRVVLSRVG